MDYSYIMKAIAVQIADEKLEHIQQLLIRMEALAQQAAEESCDHALRETLQEKLVLLREEIDHTADTLSYLLQMEAISAGGASDRPN